MRRRCSARRCRGVPPTARASDVRLLPGARHARVERIGARAAEGGLALRMAIRSSSRLASLCAPSIRGRTASAGAARTTHSSRECHARPLTPIAHGAAAPATGRRCSRGGRARLRRATAPGMAVPRRRRSSRRMHTPRRHRARGQSYAFARRGAAAEPEAAPDQLERVDADTSLDAMRRRHDGGPPFAPEATRCGAVRRAAERSCTRRFTARAARRPTAARARAARRWRALGSRDHLLRAIGAADVHAASGSAARCSSTMARASDWRVDDAAAQLPGFARTAELRQADALRRAFVAATKSFERSWCGGVGARRCRGPGAPTSRARALRTKWADIRSTATSESSRSSTTSAAPFVLAATSSTCQTVSATPATLCDWPRTSPCPRSTQAVVRACSGVFAADRGRTAGRLVGADVRAPAIISSAPRATGRLPTRWTTRDQRQPARADCASAPRCARPSARALCRARRGSAAKAGVPTRATSTCARSSIAAPRAPRPWMAQRTKAGQARPLMRAILDHIVRRHQRPRARDAPRPAYKLFGAQ